MDHFSYICSITTLTYVFRHDDDDPGCGREEEQSFAEAVRDTLRRSEERRKKVERVEEDGGAFPGNPRHPVGWVGT